VSEEDILSRLRGFGFVVEGSVYEEDHYFDMRGCPGYREGSVLRFRRVVSGESVRYWLTYKGLIRSEGVKARDEIEIPLQSEDLLTVLKMVGLRTFVIRKRRTYLSGMGLKLSLDFVECLGKYLEFEELNPSSAEEFLSEVRSVLTLLGLEGRELITESYLEMYIRRGCS
jgi:predicted adenylyl cyclase CyaB